MKVRHRDDINYGEPHIADYWAHHRPAPENLTPAGDSLWAADHLLPVLFRVDSTGASTGPIGLAGTAGKHRSVRTIASDGQRLWITWGEGITTLDLTTGDQDFHELAIQRVTDGNGALWGLHDERLHRIEPDPMTVEAICPLPVTSKIAVGHGFIWALVWDPPGRSYLFSVNPDDGEWGEPVTLEGNPQEFVRTDTGFVARLWRRRTPHEFDDTLVSLAPDGAVKRETIIAPTGVAAAIGDEAVWLSGADPFDPSDHGSPSEVRRLSAEAEERRFPVPGRPERLALGSGCVWVRVFDRTAHRFVRVTDDGHSTVTSLDHLDLEQYFPPPPHRIDSAEEERRVLERLSASLRGGWIATDPDTGEKHNKPYIDGVEIVDVRLEGSFPETEVVVTFRAERHPDVLFGRRRPIWEDSGELSDLISVMDVNLMEDVTACGYGLPADSKIGADGISWF